MNVTKRRVTLVGLFLLSVVQSRAGTPIESKAVEQAPIQTTEPWQIVVGAPAWFTFINGDVGINGIKTHVDISPSDILRRTDFLAALRGEIRKGRRWQGGRRLIRTAGAVVAGGGVIFLWRVFT
jgi:hypothetical protein